MSRKNKINILLVVFSSVIWAYVAAEYLAFEKTGLEMVLAEIFRPQKFMLNNVLIMILLLLNNTEDVKSPQYFVRCRDRMFRIIVENGIILAVTYGILIVNLILIIIRSHVFYKWSDIFLIGTYCGIFCVVNNAIYLIYNILHILFNRVVSVIAIMLIDLVCLVFYISFAFDMDFNISMAGILWMALFSNLLLILVMKRVLKKREYY